MLDFRCMPNSSMQHPSQLSLVHDILVEHVDFPVLTQRRDIESVKAGVQVSNPRMNKEKVSSPAKI